ncbi:MAG: peptide-methionine (S)-S-oxide reductase, partial [Desulfomonilaceae bacterium]|nr:peptide-methionine (S)-S-oxide reductase [Desulfomonilaceae bacterium]
METLITKFALVGLFLVAAAAVLVNAEKTLEKATFAGGCFWCMEPPFERLKGVEKVVSGYTGGTAENPTYETYAQKGHLEAIEITYDPSRVSY